MVDPAAITYRLSPPVTSADMNALFAASWEQYAPSDFTPILSRSLVYVCAYLGDQLVGYVNVAWDGGIHAFLLDTTVHPAVRRAGIGRTLVQHAVDAARTRGIHWLHVDYEPHLAEFYERAGFRHTLAGLIGLQFTDLAQS